MKNVSTIQKIWRPMAGLACASALFWIFILAPMGTWISTLCGKTAAIPDPSGSIIGLLVTCLLGLGILRSTEKVMKNGTLDAEETSKVEQKPEQPK